MNSHSYYDTEGMMEQTLTIQGAQVFVKDVGQGVPMVMLHGSPDTGAMWEPVIERLNGKIRAIVPDLPGFGRSTLPDGFVLSLDNYAKLMNELLDKLGVHEPVYLLSADFGTHY